MCIINTGFFKMLPLVHDFIHEKPNFLSAQVLSSMGEKLSDDELSEMMKLADPRVEGHINYEEFVHLMNGTWAALPPSPTQNSSIFSHFITIDISELFSLL